MGRRGVVDLARGQSVSVAIACAVVAVGLVSVSPAAGVLSRLGTLGFGLPLGAVAILLRSARDQAAPKRDRPESGWSHEGALLLGAALLYTATACCTFACLAIARAIANPVPIMLAGILLLGNAMFGFFALMSYRQRVRD